MRVRVFDTSADAAASLADGVVALVRSKPTLVLGLPTGRTPLRFYRELVRLVRASRIDVSRITTFNLDEFLGVRADQPQEETG